MVNPAPMTFRRTAALEPRSTFAEADEAPGEAPDPEPLIAACARR